MGWLDRKERRRVRKKYKIRALYRCDVCNRPIPIGGLIVIDPRKGYFPRERSIPPGLRDTFNDYKSREPKWTSCYDCDKQRREAHRHKKDHKLKQFLRVQNRVMEMIEKKPKRGYWTKEKCCHKLDGKCDRRLILRAIQTLRKQHRLKKRDGGYLPK